MSQSFAGGYTPLNRVVDGRLTLTTAVPVTTADVTGVNAVTVYFTPYKGNSIALYTGTNWKLYQFTELSVAVPATTNTPFDVFIYDNAGTLTLETTNWTNGTTRATALVTQNGVLVRSGATTRRYLGTGRTTGVSGQCEDSYGGAHQVGGKRFLWNYYNRVKRHLAVIDTTNTWTYTTATWRAANGQTTLNLVAFVIGWAEDATTASSFAMITNNTAAVTAAVGVGVNVTNANSAAEVGGSLPATGGQGVTISRYSGILAVGYNYLAWIEISEATGITTWYGDAGLAYWQAGLEAEIWG